MTEYFYVTRDTVPQRYVVGSLASGLLGHARTPAQMTLFASRDSAEVAVENTQTWMAGKNQRKAKFEVLPADILSTAEQDALDAVRQPAE